jgi:hypothetical protein
MNKERITAEAVRVSCKIKERYLKEFARSPCASSTIDARTIGHSHCLDLVTSHPILKQDFPSCYQAVENESLGAVKNVGIIGGAIRDLHLDGGSNMSIVGGKRPVQVTSLADWSTASQLRAQDGILKKTVDQTCSCHVVQIITKNTNNESGPLTPWMRLRMGWLEF